MARVSIIRKIKLEAELPADAVILPIKDNDTHVTWFKQSGAVIYIFTCLIENFESQEATQSIELYAHELKKIAELIRP